ncbi:hypothetical protein BDP27DRAFT_1401939 [Rhodocollybia butyracea]|uniref:DUF6533 domain-containing protein n=1 Tax=Rhodocollybia butyracea TaxID=206335 RepID=A0A9P5U964_9AGAR|nr:hypothetical protein BDP27DRAFT_1401939 [Rhodocollybia butyracea]
MVVQEDRLIRDLGGSTGSAFFFLAWDTLITLDDEIEYIWSKPRNSWIKWAFLIARYLSLALQLTSEILQLVITYSTAPLSNTSLRFWFALQGMVAFLIIIGAEIVMMARVYALYNRNKWVRYGFVTLILGESITALLGLILTFPPPDNFSPMMILENTPGSFEWFSCSTVVSQTVVILLSVARYRVMYKEGHCEGARILRLMIRDGTLAFTLFFLLALLMVIYHATHEPFAPDEYIWSITVIAVTECRVILNLQKLPSTRPDILEELPELTTIISNDRSRFNTSHLMTVFQESHEPPYEDSEPRRDSLYKA